MTVCLVGAGPGDPGLITARGLELVRALRGARLRPARRAASSSPRRPTDALLHPARAARRRSELNELLVELGRRGLDVVRLKGGDPFVFGRGGEEALALAEAGVPFEVVPGVSSLSAVPASAGIPVTHRGVVGAGDARERRTSPAATSTTPQLARGAGGTLVFFMGLARAAARSRTG